MVNARTEPLPRHRHRHVLSRARSRPFPRRIWGSQITIEIETGRVNGTFPRRALNHVLEWLELHRAELREAWSLARAGEPLPRIDPLE